MIAAFLLDMQSSNECLQLNLTWLKIKDECNGVGLLLNKRFELEKCAAECIDRIDGNPYVKFNVKKEGESNESAREIPHGLHDLKMIR